MTGFGEPVVAWRGTADPDAPLVVLLHGRGSNEADIIALADHLPDGPAYAAVRAPIGEGGGYAWFANRGIGRPSPNRSPTPGQFDTITAPTLVLTGSDSVADIVHATERAAAAIPRARIQVLDGHGHFAHKSDPAMVTAVVRDFVAS